MMPQTTNTQRLKALRQARQSYVARARKTIKQSNSVITSLRKLLATEPQTVPQIAAALEMDSADVLLFISALKKYGEVVEGAKDGDYFKYELAPTLQHQG